jgi:PIN domain nuclease of toxin-antitoxin system
MSIWEIAMLVARGRLAIPLDVPEWTARALAATGVQLVDLALRVLKANR